MFRFVITLFLFCSQTYISYAKVICHWIIMISLQISRIESFHKRNLFFGMIIQKRSNKDIIVGFKVAFLLLKFSSFKLIQVTSITKKSKWNHSSFLFWGFAWKQNVINEWNLELQRNFTLVVVAKRPNLSLRENDFLLHGIILISWKVLIIRSLRNKKGHTNKCIAVVSVHKCWTGKYYWHGDFSLCALNLYHTLSNCNDYYNIISSL